MRVAALDLGSNTSLLLIADVDADHLAVIRDETTITKLGQGVHANKRFHDDALKRMDACLEAYARMIEVSGAEKTIAVATSAARDVENGEELLKIGRRHGIPIRIIDGAREAELTFLGAQAKMNEKIDAVIDVGGGSTEIIGEGGKQAVSVNIGSVRLTELFVTDHPIPQPQIEELTNYIERELNKANLPRVEGEVLAVAGTPTTLAMLDLQTAYDADQINGYKLTLNQIENWATKLRAMSIEERERLPGMQPKRADVITTGALILAGVIRKLGQSEVKVSVRGVRFGVAKSWREF